MDLVEQWPLFGLRVTTPRFELRIPTDSDLCALITLAKKGVHDPNTMPFAVPWTDLASPEFERSALQYHWKSRSDLTPQAWNLGFVVVYEGEVIGMQELHTKNFAALRSTESGSWLGLEWQGRGLGKEMRAAIVRFAFDHLRAEEITSGAFVDNVASQQVSIATGYEQNGHSTMIRRGVRSPQVRFRLTRERWETTQQDGSATKVSISVDGLEACRAMLGI